jgi:hypothetical protein
MISTGLPALAADAAVIVMAVLGCGCAQLAMHNSSSATSCPSPDPLFATALPALQHPRIIVEKSARILSVYDGLRLVKKYHCCTGTISGDKEREGDRRTPQGDFLVCYKNPHSKYTLSLGLTYPNEEDARRGLAAGLITREQYDALVAGNQAVASIASASGPARTAARDDDVLTIPGADWETLWKTPLGGEVMIHGAGAARGGTAGCVGMDDADIRELYPAIPLGTPVTIRP